MAVISHVWKVAGVPTDVFSAKLSDSTGAYGVRRTDTLAVIVADGTDMSHDGDGEYSHDLGLIAVQHEYWIEIVDEDGDDPIYIHGYKSPDAASGIESTLSTNRTKLRIEVANYFGINSNSSTWGTRNTERIDRIVANGEGMFYKSTRLPDEQSIHRWSFLRQLGEFALTAGTGDYDLPADFAGFVDPMLHYLAADNVWHDVKERPVSTILKSRQLDTLGSTTSDPLIYAVVPKAHDQSTGQRFTLMVDPVPSADVTLTGLYNVNPFAISASDPYPLGGQPHSQTLIAACLAAAEKDRYGSRGDLYADFLLQLRDSIAIDRVDTTPKSFGYNGDRSGPCGDDLPWNRRRSGTVTFPAAWGS